MEERLTSIARSTKSSDWLIAFGTAIGARISSASAD